MGLPLPWLLALQSFYVGNTNFLNQGGIWHELFTCTNGVRQGCPLSPVLFALCLDPFIRRVTSLLGSRGVLRAYADDMAVFF